MHQHIIFPYRDTKNSSRKTDPSDDSRALDGKTLPVYGDGTNVRDWLCVEDHCRALLTVMKRGRTGGPISSKIKGSALLQQSTGASVEVSLSGAFTASGNRESSSVSGVPPIGPGSEPPISSNADHFPSRKVLHIQER